MHKPGPVNPLLVKKCTGRYIPAMLKEWRDTMGWSEARAARELGCAWRSYRKWERFPDTCPRYIVLACLAIQHGLYPTQSGEPAERGDSEQA